MSVERPVEVVPGMQMIADPSGYLVVAPEVSRAVSAVVRRRAGVVRHALVMVPSGPGEFVTSHAAPDWLFGALAPELREALADVDECAAEAREEGLPVPTGETITRAKELLRQLYRIRACRFEVYPLRAGEIAIDAPGPQGRSVVVVCEPDGGAVCSVNLDGCHRRAVYDGCSARLLLPDAFVKQALEALDG